LAPFNAIVHLASKTLGHALLGTSTTMATLCSNVPGGTFVSFGRHQVFILKDQVTELQRRRYGTVTGSV
jgi:hypothetical protein